MNMRRLVNLSAFLISLWSVVPVAARPGQQMDGSQAQVSSGSGETRTLLPDGRLLILGGRDSAGNIKSEARIQDPNTKVITPLPAAMNFARAWHTATVLPDGTVLVLGGVGADGNVISPAELFDPRAERFDVISSGAPAPRAFHTATLLTNGRLWIAGGVSPQGQLLGATESWDYRRKAQLNSSIRLNADRRNHAASLLPDGRVLLEGGKGEGPAPLAGGEVYDPAAETITVVDRPQTLSQTAAAGITELRASSPEDGASDVAVDALISLRFSRQLLMTGINSQTIVLEGPAGIVDASVVGAESGMLAFITAKSPLVPGTTYSVTFSGAADTNRATAAFARFFFTTAGEPVMDDQWIPTPGWRTNRPDSKWQSLPPLQAKPGVTALAGQVLKLDGMPLPHVTLSINGQKSLTDATGRFLLTNITAGHHPMMINATTANTRIRAYGIYETGVDIKGGQTNVLNYTIWMTPLDTAHTVRIPSPTTAETVVTSPLLPGLELHLPANTVITGYDGKVITELNITPIPLDRPPFPLPNVPVPIYFTIQPGSSYISVSAPSGPKGARLFYPNAFHYPPGTQFNFWNYDADNKGWFVYGQGRVAADGSRVIPDPGVVLYEFTGAMVSNPNNAPPKGPKPGNPRGKGGEPVDLSTGLFVYSWTDLTLPDVIPITLTRTYRPGDTVSRAFGIGTNHPYDMFMVGTNNTTPGGGYVWQDLILPDGGRIHFARISPCDPSGFCNFSDAVYENTSPPMDFYGATIKWGGCSLGAWMLTKKDGTVYCFPDSDGSSISQAAAPVSMHDRFGNSLAFVRDGNHNLTQIVTPNGRWIKFTYDASNRITQAQDNINRVVQYAYDAGGRLSQVTDANGGVTNYTYDVFNQMLTIQDPRGVLYLTNQYDASGRVVKQTQADNSTFQFAYTTDPITGNITETDLTDPRGNLKRMTFNANGYTTSETFAPGKPEQQTLSYLRDPNTNLINSTIDGLQHETDYGYDALGNIVSITTLAHTAGAATTQFTYDPNFNQLASVTDPLNHTTTYQRDPATGNLTAIVDPLGNKTSYGYYPNGQVQSIVDPLQNAVRFGYDGGDLSSITDPLGNVTSLFVDGAGRTVVSADSLGNGTRLFYDALSQITQINDAKGGITTLTYDPNGNLLSVQDAQQHGSSAQTTYAYDNMDRVIVRTDPLLRKETYQYDGNGNLLTFTDRRGKITTYTYDALNRRVFAGFGTIFGAPTTYESTQTYQYDTANRVKQISDTAGGTAKNFIWNFNDVTRTYSEQTPLGTRTSTYDSAGRRSSMTVSGQPAVSYTYDNANRLTQIVQGTSSTTIAYDLDSRRTSLTLPNNVVVNYGYDHDSNLTSLQYQLGSTTLGNITYTYDAAGRRVQMGGSFARTGLPQPISSSTYDADNELIQWNGMALSYDSAGNLINDGVNAYVWDARNQLVSMGSNTYQYDEFGRRSQNPAGTQFLYDGPNAIQELSGTTPTANRITAGIDEFMSRTDSTGTYAPLTDALGSVLALANSSGVIMTQYTYDPFGSTVVSGPANSNTAQYTGRENDGNGLYYYRARYYSPALQRFIAEDPSGLRGGINRFAYAQDDPILYIDPSGRTAGQVGVSLSYTFWGLTGVVSGGIAFDSSGNVALYGAYGGGLGAGAGDSVGATADVGISPNAQTINDLTGWFTNLTVNGGDGVDAAVGTYAGVTADGRPVNGVTGSVGIGGGASSSVTRTNTYLCGLDCVMDAVFGHPPKNRKCFHKRATDLSPLGGPIY
jgi:RHS repeat-associated protein